MVSALLPGRAVAVPGMLMRCGVKAWRLFGISLHESTFINCNNMGPKENCIGISFGGLFVQIRVHLGKNLYRCGIIFTLPLSI